MWSNAAIGYRGVGAVATPSVIPGATATPQSRAQVVLGGTPRGPAPTSPTTAQSPLRKSTLHISKPIMLMILGLILTHLFGE